jgi:hypothetical protein
VSRIGNFTSAAVPPGGGVARSGGGAGAGDPGGGGGAPGDVEALPVAVPVKVSFGVLIVADADAGSRGLAAPVPVNVSFGVLMVTPFAGAVGAMGLTGAGGFAGCGLSAGGATAGFCCWANAASRPPSDKTRTASDAKLALVKSFRIVDRAGPISTALDFRGCHDADRGGSLSQPDVVRR